MPKAAAFAVPEKAARLILAASKLTLTSKLTLKGVLIRENLLFYF